MGPFSQISVQVGTLLLSVKKQKPMPARQASTSIHMYEPERVRVALLEENCAIFIIIEEAREYYMRNKLVPVTNSGSSVSA